MVLSESFELNVRFFALLQMQFTHNICCDMLSQTETRRQPMSTVDVGDRRPLELNRANVSFWLAYTVVGMKANGTSAGFHRVPRMVYFFILCFVLATATAWSRFRLVSPELHRAHAHVGLANAIWNPPQSGTLMELVTTLGNVQNGIFSFTAGNKAMNGMIRNWAAAASKLNPPLHSAVLALDKEGYDELLERKIAAVIRDKRAWSMFDSKASNFRGEMYNLMSTYKWRVVQEALAAGVDVLMSDPDIVILRNPLYYLATLPVCDFYPQVDLGTYTDADVVREKGGYQLAGHTIYMNGGFVFFRHSSATRALLAEFMKYIEAKKQEGQHVEEQTYWNEMITYGYDLAGKVAGELDAEHIISSIMAGECIRYTPKWGTEGEDFTMTPLNPYLFPNYPQLAVNKLPESIVERPYMVHYNWLTGIPAKMEKMKEQGHWFVNE